MRFLIQDHKRFEGDLEAMGVRLVRTGLGTLRDTESESDIGYLSRGGILELYPGSEKADTLARRSYLFRLRDGPSEAM